MQCILCCEYIGFGGPRGCTELCNLSLLDFEQLSENLLLFLQFGKTKGNQTGGDSNFNVRLKPDLYLMGETLVSIFQMFRRRKTNPDGTFCNTRLFLQPLPSATFHHDVWFGNEQIGKNNINFVNYITEEMKKSGIIPSFLKYDNTSLRKLRTQALSDAGVDDWMISETIGHKDKKNTNLLYYRKMDHSDKLKMAQVLADPWKYSKKASLPNDINFPPFLFQSADKENFAPPAAKKLKQTDASFTPNFSDSQPEQLLSKTVFLQNCSNVVVNIHMAK